MFLLILFWVLFILVAIGYFVPLSGGAARWHSIAVLLLIGILGYMVFGNPVKR